MADTAKIKTLRDNTTGETVAPRTVVKALSGEGTAGQLVGYTEDNVVGNITPDATPTPGSTNSVQSGGVYEATKWHTNKNLLDNWYFLNAINQIGQNQYTTNGYSIDRYKLVINIEGAYINVDENGITLKYGAALYQIFERKLDADKVYTLSVLDANGVLYSFSGVGNQSSGHDGAVGFQLNGGNICFYPLNGTQITFVAAKLEIGDHQTLAHKEGDTWVLNEIPDYATELAKCQRYQRIFGGSINLDPLGIVQCRQDNSCTVTIPVPGLRNVPTITFSGSFRIITPTKIITCASADVNVGPLNGAMSLVNVDLAGIEGISQGDIGWLDILLGSYVICDANL